MILVVGATGSVGREAVRQLAEREIPVRALVHSPEKQSLVAAPWVETALGDLRDARTLDSALDGVSKALLISPLSPHLVELQSNFIGSARRAGRIHVVKLSGLATSLDSSVLSGRWHALVERQLEDSGLSFTFLRPPFFIQNLLGFALRIAAHGFFESSMKVTPVAMIDARDVASIAVAALTAGSHENRAYSVTGPQPLTLVDVALEISLVIGKKVEYRTATAEEEREQLLAKGMPEWHVELVQQFHQALGQGMASEVGLTAEWFTGKKPRTLSELIRENADRFKRNAETME
jgi:uncharacterized protein YbjT (DUF2867 family)